MNEHIIDLRSDVVTQPTVAMRDAMRDAKVGAYRDDEDPTVRLLEERCAALFDKEAATFLPSTTMANLIACLHYCRPGDQILVDQDAHVYRNELSGMVRVAGALPRAVPRRQAVPDVTAVAAILGHHSSAEAPIRLVWIENTHNVGGGAIATPTDIAELRAATTSYRVAMHADGARIFNAAVACGVPVAALAVDIDSISVGFNKGLGCPAGCVLVGTRDLIESAIPLRRMLGGRLTKGGIIAAACIAALDTTVERLAEDHARAKQLESIFESIPGLLIEAPVSTNIVRVRVSNNGSARKLVDALGNIGILVNAVDRSVIRAVTHMHITAAHIDRVRETVPAAVALLDLA